MAKISRSTRPAERPAPPPLGAKVRTAAWGLAVYTGVLLAGAIMSRSAIGAAAAQAAVAEWGAGRLDVTWSDPDAPMPAGRVIARRALRGAALGLGASALLVVAALATKAASIGPTPPRIASIALGLI